MTGSAATPARRKLHQPVRLSWARLLPLDISLALAIVALCMALCLSQVPKILAKLRLVQVVVLAAPGRLAAVERVAFEGDLRSPLDARAAQLDGAPTRFRYRYAGPQVISSGVLGPGLPAFQLSFQPAIGQADLGWSVVWLCGLRPPPPHWTAAPPLVEGLTVEQLPFVCRP